MIHHAIEHWGYWGLFVLIFIDNMNIPMPPTEVVLSLTGILIKNGQLAFFPAFIVSVVAGVLGCLAFYIIIRFGSEELVGPICKKLHISQSKVDKIDALFIRYGGIMVLVGRLIPGFRTVSLLPAALAKYSIIPFLIYVTIGTIIWNGALLYLGMTAQRIIHIGPFFNF